MIGRNIMDELFIVDEESGRTYIVVGKLMYELVDGKRVLVQGGKPSGKSGKNISNRPRE